MFSQRYQLEMPSNPFPIDLLKQYLTFGQCLFQGIQWPRDENQRAEARQAAGAEEKERECGRRASRPHFFGTVAGTLLPPFARDGQAVVLVSDSSWPGLLFCERAAVGDEADCTGAQETRKGTTASCIARCTMFVGSLLI